MAEAKSNLFDLIYPSPPTLQELSATHISLRLFRYDLSKRRSNGTLDKFQEAISLKEFLPNLPTAIETVIRNHHKILVKSVSEWAYHQHRIAVARHRILEVFDDFVCDVDGGVHYIKTAKRMLLNEQFSKIEKFRIASYSCLEEDIRLLWPSISENINNELPEYDDELRYWICLMKNKMDEFYSREYGDRELPDPIEWMFTRCSTPGSTEYFWNCTSSENRARLIRDFCLRDVALFVRFYLPKLNELEFSKFIATRSDVLVIDMLDTSYGDQYQYIFSTFMYIKDSISAAAFCFTIINFLQNEIGYNGWSNADYEMRSYVYGEVWNNAPPDFKLLAITLIFTNNELSCETKYFNLEKPRSVIFLKRFLLDVPLELRYLFWHQQWFNLITTARCEDFYDIMKLCFSNDEEIIAHFIENSIANCENIRRCCGVFMTDYDFKFVDDFLKFWCPEVQPRRELKQDLLQLFVSEKNFIPKYVKFHAVEELDSFINDAFDSIKLAKDFKNQSISAPDLIPGLISCIPEYRFTFLMKFIAIFENESTQQVIAEIKAGLLDTLKDALKSHTFWITERDGLHEFLVWCLGSEDQVVEFKRSLPVDELLRIDCPSDSSDYLDYDDCDHSFWISEFFKGVSNALKGSDESDGESSNRFK